MLSDEELYTDCLCGNDDSVQTLVEKYGDSLTLYIAGYIKDIHTAEELMIDAFSLVFAKERHIVGEGAFKAYLFKVGRNLAIRYCTKKSNNIFVRLDDLPFEPQSNALADTELLQTERNLQLYSAMNELNEEYREALYLVYLEEMSYRDAAAVMKKSEKQITKLVYHGKKRLKALLEKEGFSYDEA